MTTAAATRAEPPRAFGAPRRRSAHAQVAQELAALILRGDVQPGEALPTETELTARLGVSRTVLREATKTLAAKGLIESRPKVGTRVRPREAWNMLDPDMLGWLAASPRMHEFARNLLQMREMIEPAAAALAALHRSPEQLAEIEAAWRAMDLAPDQEAWAEADRRFHRGVLTATGNELIGSLGAMIEAALALSFRFSALHAEDYRASLSLHAEVLDAIRRQDAEAARRRTGALLVDAGQRLARIAETRRTQG